MRASSLLVRERGSKRYFGITEDNTDESLLVRERGSKHSSRQQVRSSSQVAPRAGARIETPGTRMVKLKG